MEGRNTARARATATATARKHTGRVEKGGKPGRSSGSVKRDAVLAGAAAIFASVDAGGEGVLRADGARVDVNLSVGGKETGRKTGVKRNSGSRNESGPKVKPEPGRNIKHERELSLGFSGPGPGLGGPPFVPQYAQEGAIHGR
ncbi:hypothetical protein BBP40_008409 [Aspergillus hancockii]|nr:hypothetical protein BBP40_008409 [Aspergillus hancockii]